MRKDMIRSLGMGVKTVVRRKEAIKEANQPGFAYILMCYDFDSDYFVIDPTTFSLFYLYLSVSLPTRIVYHHGVLLGIAVLLPASVGSSVASIVSLAKLFLYSQMTYFPRKIRRQDTQGCNVQGDARGDCFSTQ